MAKETKVISKRKKFVKVKLPLINSEIELIGNSPEDVKNKSIKLDLTRQLKGKSVEAIVKVKLENEKAVAYPKKIKLMPYFIRRMIRKRISYIEDSFETPSQESMIKIKPFLITRKRVSKAVRKALRNRCRNWLEDYISERNNNEIFREILSNRMQKPLSLSLKKTYPLSLCEIRVLEIKRDLNPTEIPKIKEKRTELKQIKKTEKIEQGLDQLAEIEEEQKKKQAEEEIKRTQKKAEKIESEEVDEKQRIKKEKVKKTQKKPKQEKSSKKEEEKK